jgi:GNAT superfamily N-acetyltransferase
MFKIRHVNNMSHSTEQAIRFMQKECLPLDTVLSPKLGWWWIAYCDGRLAGFAAMLQSTKDPHSAYLARAGTLEAFRSKGLQQRLIKERVKFAKDLGLSFAVTDTTDNIPSSNALIRCGFTLFQPEDPWGLPNTLYWRKRIALQRSTYQKD